MSFIGDILGIPKPQSGGAANINIPAPAAPTPAPPAPDRSDSDIQNQAARDRRRYGVLGGASQNVGTGGLGVSSNSTYSAVTALLGGGR